MDHYPSEQSIQTISEKFLTNTGLQCYYFSTSDELTNADGDFVVCKAHYEMRDCNCLRNLKTSINNALITHKHQIEICNRGLIFCCAPVYQEGIPKGYFLIEPVIAVDESMDQLSLNGITLVDEEALENIYMDVPKVQRCKIGPYAQLLSALINTEIPEEVSCWDQYEAVKQEVKRRVLIFSIDSDMLNEFPTNYPLSYYIYDNETSSENLRLFWETVEVKTSDIFFNVISGRTVKATLVFNDIMQMAYCEPSLEKVKVSAEMLFHIIFLKYYKEEFYDIAFYRLAFDTIINLFQASKLEEVEAVMRQSFDELCMFYNFKHVNKQSPAILQTILNYIEHNYYKKVSVKDIASILYMSAPYVSRLFKKETTMTIKQCLTETRMRHAQELLLNTDYKVKEISIAVGYTNLRAFYKNFSKHFGVTCSEMRKKYSIYN